jgi:hypothetical protein
MDLFLFSALLMTALVKASLVQAMCENYSYGKCWKNNSEFCIQEKSDPLIPDPMKLPLTVNISTTLMVTL